MVARGYRVEVNLGHLAVIRKEAGELAFNITAHVRRATVLSLCAKGQSSSALLSNGWSSPNLREYLAAQALC